MGLSVIFHVVASANIDGKDVSRPYTPIYVDDAAGKMVLLIKRFVLKEHLFRVNYLARKRTDSGILDKSCNFSGRQLYLCVAFCLFVARR